MSQHDFDIAKADANTGITVRAAINAALQALASLSSGSGDPSITYPFQIKVDTGASPAVVYIRKSDNSAWVRFGYIDGTSGQLIVDDATDAGSLTMQGEASASNASQVTVTSSPTTILTLDLGSVTAGDRIYLDANAVIQKGGTLGGTQVYVEKDSGTATIQTYNTSTALQSPDDQQPASSYQDFPVSGVIKVTGTGTLVLRLRGTSSGSNGTVQIGSGQIYAFFLRKQ